MQNKAHNKIVSFIWGIADDVLRDVFVRGKYRDIILPFTVLRRLDVLLEETKEKVLEADQFLEDNQINNKSSLEQYARYPFYNTSSFTMGNNSAEDARYKYASLMSDPDRIDSNLRKYLDGFSPNVQEIISKFKIRNQLDTMKEAGLTFALIEKLVSSEINLSPYPKTNTRGEEMPGLTNLGMGYVFEELIRKFNEENNEEAGEHFTPREIIRLMTHIIFEPLKDQFKPYAQYAIYDPACGSGGMLTESEEFALRITQNKVKFSLHGQEVNPETYAICTSDLLIKDQKPENIKFGSTLGADGFPGKVFDFMLSNPPYGKSWKIDMDKILEGKTIIDPRFVVGTPRSSDGQLLFLANMASKMKHQTELGSRVASVHNGSALFTGDAGQGESNIRRWLIENDWLDCIIGLPKNMFYNTGIATYIFVLSNRKEPRRKGKVQLIDASGIYQKMRKSLGQKSYELSKAHIREITDLYLQFEENKRSKIFDNADFGYHKITVERPLRLACQFSDEHIASLRFTATMQEEMQELYHGLELGKAVYTDLAPHKERILAHWKKTGRKVDAAKRRKLLDTKHWQKQGLLMETAQTLQKHLGTEVFLNWNTLQQEMNELLRKEGIKLSSSEKKQLLQGISYRDEAAEPVIRKVEKDGHIHYEPDTELRDTENVPLQQEIETYFAREVLPHVPDAWIDHSKTAVGYEISFTKYFYQYQPLRGLEEITEELWEMELQSEGLLRKILEIKGN